MPVLSPVPPIARTAPALTTVLLADGDGAALDVMRRYLLLRGYEVEVATGGVDCLAKLRRRSAGVLVLDLDLPWGGADGVLALMRGSRTLSRLPVILTSARPGAADRPDAVPVLEKPFPLASLLDAIRVVTGSGSGAVRVGRCRPDHDPCGA